VSSGKISLDLSGPTYVSIDMGVGRELVKKAIKADD
jgi:hypothetical protein